MLALKRFIAFFIVLAAIGSPFVMAEEIANGLSSSSSGSIESIENAQAIDAAENADAGELKENSGSADVKNSAEALTLEDKAQAIPLKEAAPLKEGAESPATEQPVSGKAKPVPPPAAQSPVKVNGVSSLLSVFVGLLFILGLILALAWFVKRIGQGGITANNHLRIVASLPLGTRERLALVDVGGKQILLGLTPQNINTLHVFDEPVIDSASAEPSEFALKLRSLLNPTAAKNNQTTEPHP